MEATDGRRPLAEGTVSRVAAQKTDPTRVSLFIDGEYAFGLSADVALREGLRRGLTLSVGDQERMLHQDQAISARKAAVEYISRRSRTSRELVQWMERKGYSVLIVQEVVARMQSLGYVDDASYARRYAEARASRGYGARRITQELGLKGISDANIRNALQAVIDEDGEAESVIRLARQRYDRLRNEPDPRKRKKKVFDYLVRRGFSPDVIRDAIDQIEERPL